MHGRPGRLRPNRSAPSTAQTAPRMLAMAGACKRMLRNSIVVAAWSSGRANNDCAAEQQQPIQQVGACNAAETSRVVSAVSNAGALCYLSVLCGDSDSPSSARREIRLMFGLGEWVQLIIPGLSLVWS